MTRLHTLIIIIGLSICHKAAMSQTNVLEMDLSWNGLNTIAFDKELNIVLTSKDKVVSLFSTSDTIELNGIFGIASFNDSTIYTTDYDDTNDVGLIRSYTWNGRAKDSIKVSHYITGIIASKKGLIYLTTFNKDTYEGTLYKVNVEEDEIIEMIKGLEFTSVHEMSNGNIATSGGGINYILSPTGKLIKEIWGPHRSFGKLNHNKDLFLILQEYSDGSYLDVYSEEGKKINSFTYVHKDKNPIATRRSPYPTLMASFVDFDISPNRKMLIVKDQFDYVYMLNRRGKAKKVYVNSSNWNFLTFIDEFTFVYYDLKENKMNTKKIK